MTTLESLHEDLKFLILSSLPTVRSLKSLCRASSKYRAVFTEYQSAIESSVYLSEALERYSRESLWLARYHKRLHTLESRTSAVVAVLEYIVYPEPPPPPEDFYHQGFDNGDWRANVAIYGTFRLYENRFSEKFSTLANHRGPLNLQKNDKKAIIKYHRTIVDIFQRLVRCELTIISPDPPHSLEKYKIRNETDAYFLVTPVEEEAIIEGLYRYFLGLEIRETQSYWVATMPSLTNLWGVRGVAAVWAARDFMVSRIERAGGHKPVISVRPEYSLDPDDPIVPVHNSIPRLALTHDFPDNILTWLDGGYDGKHMSRIQEISDITGQALSTSDPWNTDFTGFVELGSDIRFKNPEDPILQALRLEKDLCLVDPKTGKAELRVCLWDSWRLKEYGYTFRDVSRNGIWDSRAPEGRYLLTDREYYEEGGILDQLARVDEINAISEKNFPNKDQEG
ncbi:hypothetical protein TWF718_007498 [Orbilia javanica]|uniref:F-box domain-containing protein n=1 Tax=Orbilia javanica TaxID=47235 RepID=A0AAN8N0N4_9PEZI